jgi:hypothetical protein
VSSQTVYEHIQKQLGAVDKEIGTLLAELDRLRRREVELMKELTACQDARDAFRDQCRQKDILIEELRDLAKQPTRKQANR